MLEGLVAGKANKTIAFDLGISPRTVEIYRANLMTKMAASSLSELVRMAMIAGILEGGSELAAERACGAMRWPLIRIPVATAGRQAPSPRA